MNNRDPGTAADRETPRELLHAFVEASAARAEELLARLLVDHAAPIVDRVLRAKLRGAGGSGLDNGGPDLRSEALAQVLGRLRALRQDGETAAIRDFPGYVAVVARNVVYEQLRRARPEREQLRRRLWQVLSQDPRFELRRGASGEFLCGAAAPRTSRAAAPKSAERDDLTGRLEALFARFEGPVAFGQVLAAFYEEQQEAHPAPVAAPVEQIEAIADTGPDVLTRLGTRATLAALWEEVEALPTQQAWALLLNLRDDQGHSALLLLPVTGTASIRRIAEALHLSAERLAMMWNRLPLEDREIAELLELTRQQVINLRKSARERLARRMAKRGLDW